MDDNCFGNYNIDDPLCAECDVAVECYEKWQKGE